MLKERITRTPEEERFYEKYGNTFDGIPLKYVEMFDELDIILDKYDELCCNYLEDLKAYALMYRNVHLRRNSIVDRAFFVKREEFIKGYKEKIYTPNASSKNKVLKYYLEYGQLFEMYCFKQIGIKIETYAIELGKFFSFDTRICNYSLEDYNVVKNEQFGEESGIVTLTEEQCEILLKNISELITISKNSNYNLHIFPIYENKRDFVMNILIPYFYSDKWDLNKKCVKSFVENKEEGLNNLPENTFEKGKSICQLYNNKDRVYKNYTDATIEELLKEKERLLKPSHDLEILDSTFRTEVRYPTSYVYLGSPYFSSWLKPKGVSDEEYRKKLEEEDEKRRELERQLKLAKEIEKKQKQNQLETQIKENQPKINEIERSINRLRIQYRDGIIEKYNAFIDELCILMSNNTNVWAYLFGHQIELQEHFSSFYKNEYIHIKQTRLKESIITENIVGGRHIPVRHIPVYVQYMHSSEGYDIDRLYKKTGKQSKHLTQARRWATYIKPIVKEQREREEQVRKEEEGKRLEQYRFNIRNKHKNDSKISFREEDHIYVVDGTPLDSVTSFVKNCFPEFNADYHAKRKAEAMGITKEEVLKMWDKKGRESREQGTKMHKKIEAYYLGKTVSTDETFDLFKIFANKITLKPYRTEWAVYDWEQKIAGTIDFVDYQNGEYIIYDWKRSDKLIAKNGLPIKSNQYGEKALAPIDNLDDSPYYHYALQLSLYKYILEKDYGIIVSKLRLGIFHPSYNKPYVLEMPYLKNEIDTLFNLKSEVIF